MADAKSKVSIMETQLQASKSRTTTTNARAKAVKEHVSFVGARAIEEFQWSKAFEDEVAKGCLDAFYLRFAECKKKVAEAFLRLDLDSIINIEPEENGGEGEGKEAIEGKVKIEDEPVSLEEAPEATTRAEAIEIAEVVVGTFEANLAPILEDLVMGPGE